MPRLTMVWLLLVWAGVIALTGCLSVPPVPEQFRARGYKPAQSATEGEGWLFGRLTGRPVDGSQPEQSGAASARPGQSGQTSQSGGAIVSPGASQHQTAGTSSVQPSSSRQPAEGLFPTNAAAVAGERPTIRRAYPPAPKVPATAVTAPGSQAAGTPTSLARPAAQKSESKGFDLSELAPENVYKRLKAAAGLGPDETIARQNLQEGEALFRQKKYAEAIAKFKTAVARWPDSTIEEDALFLLAECYFFTDKYPRAEDTYAQLLKKYDNTRYLDTVVARLFAIGRYWEQYYREHPEWVIQPNLFDRSRPWFDTFGNAIAAYEKVRLHDPTGPLADDAVMATANAYFVKGEYENAAYHYRLLRKEYPNSEFQVPAHILGLQAVMRVYQGEHYDGDPLQEAEEIAQQALTQFGSQLGEEKARMQQAAAAIKEMKARRDWAMGQYYEQKRYYGAARTYYHNLIDNYPDTHHAAMARRRLEEISDKPDVPPNRFKWLTSLFPADYE